jgi:hypothetical protein
VYCSKHAKGKHSVAKSFATDDGNIWFKRTEHTWEGEKCKYCGANKRDYDRGEGLETHAYAFTHTDDIKARLAELFGGNMQFDVVIGNPPYQLGQSGGDAVGGFAMPIYQEFVKAAKSLDPRFVVMVTPSRWFAGGRGLDEYRSEMLADKRMRALVDFPDAGEAFPGTQIKGGVSYFVWDNSWNDACEVTTICGGEPTSAPMKRYLGAYDVVVRRNEAVPILEKVLKINSKDEFGNLASKVSPIQPFSIRTNFRGAETPKGIKKPVGLIGNGGETFIDRSDVPRNDAWIDEWKVLLGRAYGAGDAFPHQIFNHPIIAKPGTACTETYLVISRFKKEADGVTVSQWSSILMLRNLKSPETYFQSAFRVQSPWSIKNPNGDNPNEEEIVKPICFVFDFAPTRALRQLSEYAIGLSPNEANPENAVRDLVSFLPVLAYDGANMTQIDAGGILDIAMAGTSATLLARKWESALLVNGDNDTLRRILDNPEALAAVESIEGWRALGDNVLETIINQSEKIKELKKKAKEKGLTPKEEKELTEEEKEYKSKRKLIQEKLIKFATRIPAFMYLTDLRENTLQDVITKLEPELFLAVTGLTVKDFHMLVRLKVFNTEQMNQAVFAFRRYEDASLHYTGIESHEGLTHYGLYDTVVARE